MFEFGLLMVLRPTRAALRFIIREPGEQYVTMPGMKETPLWCVACWDTLLAPHIVVRVTDVVVIQYG